jgi:uncharacterized protein (TIGR02996 family)
MSTEAAFLNAIRAAPEDDTARLVYADYLDEQGGATDSARAEFIRIQVRLAKLDEADPTRDALEDRENELLRVNEREWLGPLSAPVAQGLTRWRFERGFVGEVRVDTRTLTLRGDELFDRHPISRVRLGPVQVDEPGPMARLAKREWWSRVRELRLTDFATPSVRACSHLIASPHLTALRHLEIRAAEARTAPPETAHALAGSRWLSGLEELRVNEWSLDGSDLVPVLDASAVHTLRLSGCTFTQDGLAALLSGAYGNRPCRVELADGNLSANLWPALSAPSVRPILKRLSFTGAGRGANLDLPTLLSAPAAGKLEALDVGETNQSGESVVDLTTSDFPGRATELGLTRCQVPAAVMTTLAQTPAPNLRKLRVGETGLRTAGVRALCEAEWAGTLTHLDLMRNYLDDEALRALAHSGRFVNVRRLDLRVNSPDLADDCRDAIGDPGVIALASAPSFARLRHLNLYRTRVTVRGVEALLLSPHLRLCELELGGYDLGADLPQVLAQAQALARVTKLGLSFTPALGGDALLPLAESPYLSPLCQLDIRYNNTSERVRARLAARLGRRLEDHPAVSSW